jgi:two-component system chemotaxis response regulator CheY
MISSGGRPVASILIVDDSYIARMKIRNVVTRAGHIIAGEAENGLQALNVFSEVRPDLVTLDITMPVMDGIETLKNIIEINPKALVVMVSALGQQFMVLESIKSGARHFVVKPFEEDGLLKIIAEVLHYGPNPKAAQTEKQPEEANQKPVEVSDNQDGFNIENISGTFI